MLDPFRALGEIVVGLHRTGKLNKWFELLFSMFWSYGVAFSFAMGTALRLGDSALPALGAGLIAGAGAVCAVFFASPLTRGMVVSVPRGVPTKDAEIFKHGDK